MQKKRKNPAAVALGRLGGKASALVKKERIPATRRSEIASAAGKARWDKWRREHGES